MQDKNKKNQEINIEISEEVAEGVYTNFVIVSHSESEFIFDFIRKMPGVPQARVKSRMVMTPQNARRLFLALRENLKHYENLNGPIRDNEQPSAFLMNFNKSKGQA